MLSLPRKSPLYGIKRGGGESKSERTTDEYESGIQKKKKILFLEAYRYWILSRSNAIRSAHYVSRSLLYVQSTYLHHKKRYLKNIFSNEGSVLFLSDLKRLKIGGT